VNKLVYIVVGGALVVLGAAAQDTETMAKAKAEAEAHGGALQVRTVGAVKGMTVTGVPYSGEEVNENNQTLADGTRIHLETRTTVYRDSQGRTRRDTPDSITITDPVASVTYLLDPKTMTGQKLSMTGIPVIKRLSTTSPEALTSQTVATAGGADASRSGSFGAVLEAPGTAASSTTLTVTTSKDGPTSITVNGVPLDEKAVAEAMAKAKVNGSTQTVNFERREVTTSSVSGYVVGGGFATAASGGRVVRLFRFSTKPKGESIGNQVIEGVNAEGVRNVTTIETGSLGNDRPIRIVTESWYSPELQMVIMSKHSDPMTGDETFRLTNISRSEPAAYLFQLPAGYQVTDRK
jgi:hypothetical protein